MISKNISKETIKQLIEVSDNLKNCGQGASILQNQIIRFLQEEIRNNLKKNGITSALNDFPCNLVYHIIMGSFLTRDKILENTKSEIRAGSFTYNRIKYHWHTTTSFDGVIYHTIKCFRTDSINAFIICNWIEIKKQG